MFKIRLKRVPGVVKRTLTCIREESDSKGKSKIYMNEDNSCLYYLYSINNKLYIQGEGTTEEALARGIFLLGDTNEILIQ